MTLYLQDHKQLIKAEERDNLLSIWGSVPLSMLALYKASTNGDDWSVIGDVLMNVGMGYYFIFLAYIAFYTCVVTNTITSLFIETTMAYAEKDTQHVITDKLERKDEYVKKLKLWFCAIDNDCTGAITYDQFERNANCPEVHAFAE